MSYQKKSNLSNRSERRRVEEELKNRSVSTIDQNVTSMSNLTEINNVLPQRNFIPVNTLVKNNFAETPQRCFNDPLFDKNLQNELGCILSDISLSSSQSSSESSSDEGNDSFSNKSNKLSIFISLIAEWAVNLKIPQNALNSLLVILRKHTCFENLPKDSRTILQTKPLNLSNFHTVEPGKYYHFGLANAIKDNIPLNLKKDASVICIVAGIDGLPIFKSTAEEFWPILAYIRPNNNNVFPVGIYCGNRKPLDSNTFLKYFVDEINLLNINGIKINGKDFKVIVDVLCCDAPAKSFILKTKGHTGFSSCSSC